MHEKEDTAHMLQCQHLNAIKIWDIQLNNFVDRLEKYSTCPSLLTAIYSDLDQWRRQQPFYSLEFLPESIQPIVQDMRTLTYSKLLEGLIPKLAVEYQEAYYRSSPQC